ncbi:Telomere end binding protein [Penicillium atrosanguineum]|nr:Telomere end binding protein [Penicillium atrosanguineum]
MDATDSTALALPTLTRIPIAQLSPTLEQLEEKCILATVSLVWPYSSSTKSLSLSLAEPDFRLRRSNGQVKATFHGRIAEKVAESHVGIGDTVRLALKDAGFVGNDAATQTPGRNVAWDLQFDNGVSLEINLSSKNLSTVIIEQSPRLPHDTEKQLPSTPRVISIHPTSDTAHRTEPWSSPAFARIGQSPFKAARDSAFDPFTDEDGSIPGKGRKRPRYSFQRDEWRIENTSTNSQEDEPEDLENEWEKELEDEMNTEEDAQTTPKAPHNNDASLLDNPASVDQENAGSLLQDCSSVFVKPSLDIAGSLFGRRAPQINNEPTEQIETGLQGHLGSAPHLPTDTPQLRPVPSPGLPIPSPIVSNNNNSHEYFSLFHAQQAQTLQSIVTGTEEGAVSLVQSSMAYISPPSQPLATIAPVEQLESTQHDQFLSSPLSLGDHDQESLAERETEDHLTEQNHEQPAQSTEFFNSPTFQKPLVFNEPESVAESVDRHTEGIGRAEEAPDDGMGFWHEEPASGSESKRSDIEDIEGSPAQTDHALGDAMVNAARVVVEMEPAEDEIEEHAPKAIESEDEIVEAALPVEDHPTSPSHSGKSNDDEEEVLYNEDDEDEDAEDSVGEDVDEEEYGYEDEYSSDEDPQTAQLPRPHLSQPEIIVLDSDSEDELASDQPASTPLQPTQRESSHNRESYTESRVANFAKEEEGLEGVEGEEEEEEEEEEYESDSDAVEDRYHGEDNEQIHDSDMDDESSVDESLHARYVQQHSSREHSIDEESVEEEHDEEEEEIDTEEPQASQQDSNPREKPGAVIDLDSDAQEPEEEFDEEPEEQSDYESNQESEKEAGKDQQTSRMILGSSGRFMGSLDGANDRDLLRSPMNAEVNEDVAENEEENEVKNQGEEQTDGPEEDNVSQPQLQLSGTKDKLVNGESPGDTENLLPISGSGRQAHPSQEKTEVSLSRAKSEQPLGLKISSASDLENFGPKDEARLDKGLVSPENAAPRSLTDTLYTRQQDGKDDVNVAVSTTENGQVDHHITKILNQSKSPETPKVTITKPPVPDRNAHGLRSKLSYFAPLAALVDHYNALVDTISIIHEATPISKGSSGSRDYFVTVQLTDPSMAGTTLQAQIFRRTKSAMPSLAEGNAVLLRDFKVRSYDHSIMLISVESSSWAIFDGSAPEAHMSGPPVEYGSQERAYASGLRRWYTEVGASHVADNQLQASIERDSMDRGVTPSDVAISEAGSFESAVRGDSTSSSRGTKRTRRRDRRVTIHELRDGTRYTEVGSPGSRESIHELRDGTVYADL